MINLHAVATRHHGRITVDIGGQLPTPCDVAEIIDKYPGGHRVYIVDPGAAQVFISEWRERPGPCADVVVPWHRTVDIIDETHKEVQIFVNEQKQLTVPVTEAKNQYDVYRILIEPPAKRCLIIADGLIVPMIYQKVFGPASYQDCVKYVKQNCQT
ncbi:MAG TPA: hypothetical protein VJA94_10090 [Candidatus Angelobacter sp.]